MKKHSEAYNELKRIISKYNDSNYTKKSIEELIEFDECLIIECYTSEMKELLEMLDKQSNLYQILVEQIKNHIEELLSNDFQNIEYIKEIRPYEDIFEIKKNLEKFDEFKSIIRQYFRNNIESVIERIYDYAQFKLLKIMCKNGSKMDYTLERIAHIKSKEEKSALLRLSKTITKLCECEKINIEDIEKIGSGKFSEVYGINDKVIKISRGRTIWMPPDNPYMLRPSIRELIEIGESNIYGHLYIEVAERVETISKDDNNEELKEELYNLYINLRKLGIIWCDVKADNVGRLEKAQGNNHLSNEILSIKDNPMYSDKITLPQGSLVIIDNDLMFTEEEFDSLLKKRNLPIKKIMNYLSYEFYKRYEEEYLNRKGVKDDNQGRTQRLF